MKDDASLIRKATTEAISSGGRRSPERRAVHHPRAPLGNGQAARGHRRVDDAGADDVDANSARRPVERQRLAEHQHAALRRAVGGSARVSDDRVDRADHDDGPAATRRDQVARDGASAQPRALQVDVDDAIEVGLVEVLSRPVLLDARARGDAVHRSKMLHGLLDHLVAGAGVADVDANRDRAGKTLRGFFRRVLGDVSAHDVVSAGSERPGRGRADARTRPGDDCDRHTVPP